MSRSVGRFTLDVGEKGVFRLAGSRGFVHNMKGKSRRAMRSAVRAASETALTNALVITPIEHGNLRSSGRVGTTQTATGSGGVHVLGYVEFTAPYADPVHEIPEPPNESVGGRSANHEPPTTSHFLEIAFLQLNDDFADMVGEFFMLEMGSP